MGQKSVLLTLKSSFINLSLQTKYSKYFLYGNLFIFTFKELLWRKHISVVYSTINFLGNVLFLNLTLFYKTSKLFFYKKKKFKGFKYKKFHLLFVKQLFKNLKLLRINVLIFSIKNLNKKLNLKTNKKLLIYFYKKTKLYLNTLFQRRFTLFFDFLKQIVLLLQGNIKTLTFLQYVCQLFKYLHKKVQVRFFAFFKLIGNLLITVSSSKNFSFISQIKGFKFLIKGRLQGKMRADSKFLKEGKIPSQSFDKNVDIAKQHVCTLYGVYGLTLWIYRN